MVAYLDRFLTSKFLMFLSTLEIFSVSRSFPFISKTLDYDFVGLATQAMMWTGSIEQFAFKLPPKPQKVGVKAGVFIRWK